MTIPKNTKVLVVGTYCGLNKGDRLMQQVTANAIKEAGGTPCLASPFPHIDKKLYRDIPIVKARRRNLPLSLFQCMMLWILPRNLQHKYAQANEELKHFSDAALVIDTSGDMLTEDYGPHVALSHLFPLLYCLLLKKRLFILAQSVGPFSLFKGLFRKVFQHAEQVNVRDEISYRYLEPFDIKGLTQVADLGFLLKQKSFDTSSITGSPHFSGRKLIGICPSALFFEKFATDKANVTLDLFCQMLNRAAAKHNLAYVLVPHVLTPSGSFDDFNFSEEMVKRITEPCQIADSTLEPSELKHLVSKLSAMITFRMHGAIAAIDSYTPTIAISYSHKTDGLFEMLQLDKWVVANTSDLILDVETKLSMLLDDTDNIRERLKSAIPNLRAKAGLNQLAIQKALN